MGYGDRIDHDTASRSGDYLMNSENKHSYVLPPDARNAIWRIFGGGDSPKKRISTYELIKPMIDKHVSSHDSTYIIDKIRSWFESYGNGTWLKSDVSESVASLIVEGVGTERSETATWAIGSIDADMAASMITSAWPTEQIDAFVEDACIELQSLCDDDDVLDVSRCTRFISFASLDPKHTKIPKDALILEGRLETYQNLDEYSFELVHSGLYRAVGNLIDLVIDLRPNQFKSLMNKLNNPVVRARAANRMIANRVRLDHRTSVEWVTRDSCDAEVALAIVHTLNTVNGLDRDIRAATQVNGEHYHWSTGLRIPQDDLDSAAADLLTGLVDRLGVLDPPRCAGWIGELLSRSPYMLDHDREGEVPRRIEQLEEKCIDLLARLVREWWSDELLVSLIGGLRLTPRDTWTRHLAELAWKIRDESPERAEEIAQATLEEDKRYIAKGLKTGHLYLDGSDWHTRQWTQCLGIVLALSQDELDLTQWISEHCRALPLSVWDAEENHEAFSHADKAARHWFVVALLAIPALVDLNRRVEPATVLDLAEKVFAHCWFTKYYLRDYPDASECVETAARCAVEYGEPNETWLLQQARNPGVGPRALWALIDHLISRSRLQGKAHISDILMEEFARASTERFRDGDSEDLESLRFWGQLWTSLEVVDEAEHTAKILMALLQRHHNDGYRILVLKLFALVHSRRRLSADMAQYFTSLYHQLWPGYTPPDRRGDRKEIDDLLQRSDCPLL